MRTAPWLCAISLLVTIVGCAESRPTSSASRTASCPGGESYVYRVIGGYARRNADNPFGLCVSDQVLQGNLVEGPLLPLERAEGPSRTFYVAIDGNDGSPCTEPAPCRTIQHAVDQLAPGDTVIVRQGNYREFFIVSGDRSGTSWSAPTTFKVYPRETVVIRGFSLGFSFSPASYMVMDGFVVDGEHSTEWGAGVNVGHHIRMQNMEVMNVDSAAGVGGCAYCEYLAMRVHDIAWPPGQNPSVCGHGDAPDGYCHGIYSGAESVLIEGGEFYRCNGFGLHLRLAPHNNVVRNTRIHDNSNGGIIETSGGNTYYNNVIFKNAGWGGITVSGNSQVYNNTIYGSTNGSGIFSRDAGNHFRNNIVYNNPDNIALDQPNSQAENDHNLTTDPSFVNGSAGDFHLQAGSPAIDRGADLTAQGVTSDADGVPRPQDGDRDGMPVFDIGAYEYGGPSGPDAGGGGTGGMGGGAGDSGGTGGSAGASTGTGGNGAKLESGCACVVDGASSGSSGGGVTLFALFAMLAVLLRSVPRSRGSSARPGPGP